MVEPGSMTSYRRFCKSFERAVPHQMLGNTSNALHVKVSTVSLSMI